MAKDGKGGGSAESMVPEVDSITPIVRPASVLAARLSVLKDSMERHLQDLSYETRKSIGDVRERGLLAGDSPKKIEREIRKKVNTISKIRAKTIARTEVIRAHAEGTLDRFETLGIDEVSPDVEFTATKLADGSFEARVCKRCRELDGKVYKISDAHGIIPVHPNCRCAWRPAIVVENRDRVRDAVSRAVG